MLVVDAWNVLGVVGVLPRHLAGLDLDSLTCLIRRSRYAGRSLLLVCDGFPPEQGGLGSERGLGVGEVPGVGRGMRLERGHAVWAFSGANREADDVIEGLLSARSDARRMLVVSSDRRVRAAAGRAGAESIDSAGFLRQLVFDEQRRGAEALPEFATQVPLDRYSIAHWMSYFGVDYNGLLTVRMGQVVERSPADAPVDVQPVNEQPIDAQRVERPGEKAGGGDRTPREKKRRDGSAVRSTGKFLGERLSIPLPAPRPGPTPKPVQGAGQDAGAPDARGKALEDASEAGSEVVGDAAAGEASALRADREPMHAEDAWIGEALRAWAGRISAEDLDMEKWL
ncbi:MAG: hypothetical protein RBS39_01365 [Phycisphaerales bacterium]|nr:hypothetical protein [Phycisphaerales bacterium]